MTALTRTLNAGTTTAIGRQHTQPFHICKLALPTTGNVYLSEGPAVTWDNGLGDGSQSYLEGRIRVGPLQWDSDGAQSCTLEVLDDATHAAWGWFLGNKIGNTTVTLWIAYREMNGTVNTPILYATGSCDSSELTAEGMKVSVITVNTVRKYFPNTYIGAVGCAHLPQERAVVFWNNTTYVLERDYE